MLEIRPVCEHCGKLLPNTSVDAMICSYECTFCEDCVHNVLHNVCPNCGGGFEKRPVRPAKALLKDPASKQQRLHPVQWEHFQQIHDQFRGTVPEKR